MRVHVLGGGSLGSLFAFHLSRAGVPTSLLLRPARMALLKGTTSSLRVTAKEPESDESCSVQCEPSEGEGAPIDLLIVSVKAFDVKSALAGIHTRLRATTSVVLLCNGALAVADELEPHSGPLLVATSTHGAWSRGARDVHHAGKGETWIGPLGRATPRPGLQSALLGGRALKVMGDARATATAQEFLANHGLGAHIEDAAATERRLWLKLAANAVLNPLTALWDCQNGEVLRRSEGREMTQAVCGEISDLASSLASSELQMSTAELVQFVHDCAAANALNYSSMHQDVKYGRRTEVEYLNGWIARKSVEVGITSKAWLGRNQELADAIRQRRSGRE